MKVNVTVRLNALRCLQPSESSGDDPYLWTFFYQLDGNTVHQLGPGQLAIGSVEVVTADLNHGNLGREDVTEGGIAIPPALGQFSTSLRPMQFVSASGDEIHVPGVLVAIVLLADEDSSLNSSAQQAHDRLHFAIKTDANTFVNQLDLPALFSDAGKDVLAGSPTDRHNTLSHHASIRFTNLLNAALERSIEEIKTLFDIMILVSEPPARALFSTFIDHDDLLAIVPLVFREEDLLAAPDFRRIDLNRPLVGLDDGEIYAFYDLSGTVEVGVTASDQDLSELPARITIDKAATEVGIVSFTDNKLCVNAGDTAYYSIFHFNEDLSFLYHQPLVLFDHLVWSIDGVDLIEGANPVTIPDKLCKFPYFDKDHPSGPRYRTETRSVHIHFKRFTQGTLEGMTISNEHADGHYLGMIAVDGVFPNSARIRLGTGTYGFDGQWLESPFFEQFNKCMKKYDLSGYAKSKHVDPRDLWGPYGRKRAYEENMRVGEQMVAAGLLSRSRFEVAQKVLREHLNISEVAPSREDLLQAFQIIEGQEGT